LQIDGPEGCTEQIPEISFSMSHKMKVKFPERFESWVLGKAESIGQLLKPKQNFLITTYKKYGLNLNGALFIAMLIAIPEIAKWYERAAFIGVVFVLLNILLMIHNKFIPNTAVYLQKIKPSFVQRAWPSILSWVIAATSSVTAAYVFSLLKSTAT
jgi:hypothetical protein